MFSNQNNKPPVINSEIVTLSDRFRSVSTLYPEQIAIKSEDYEISYAELDTLSDIIATMINETGKPKKQAIALMFEHGCFMLAAMLGVVKSGNFWVCVDSDFPIETQHYIIEDSGCTLILTDNTCHDSVIRDFEKSKQIIDVQRNHNNVTVDISAITNNSSASDIACIIYTSGTTGFPKGVIHTHRNLLHLIDTYTKVAGITSNDRLSFLTTYYHMAGLNDILRALFNGATLYPYNLKKFPIESIAQWLRDNNITIYNSVPTIYRYFVNSLTDNDAFPTLRLINLGGEKIYSKDVENYKKHFSDTCQLMVILGLTEISCFRHYLVNKETVINDDLVPAGFALNCNNVLILDDDGNELAANQVGEIVVESDYLTLGYLNQTELTQKTIKKYNGKSVFYTGDLGKLSENGCLYHLGRKDNQIKIRGYRIELTQIEAALQTKEEVSICVASTYEVDQSKELAIVVYVVAEGNKQLPAQEIIAFLKTRLPSYMIPSAVMYIDSVPKTAIGKADYKALPIPKHNITQKNHYTEPSTEIEEKVAEIWSKILNIEKIGIDDDFFDLGGHSLNLTSIVATIRTQFSIELSIKLFYEKPTIKLLSEFISSGKVTQTVAIAKIDRKIPLELSYAQNRMSFLNEFIETPGVYNVHCGIDIIGHVDIAILRKSFDMVINRHELLRTSFVNTDNHVYQQINDSIAFKVEKINLIHLENSKKDETLQSIINQEICFPFDLKCCPLFRVNVIELEGNRSLLLFVAHHIIFDGQSMAIFLKELSISYEAYLNDKKPEFAELPFQYVDYAYWQKHRVEKTDILKEQIDYWKNNLSGELPVLSLPTDYPRPLVQSYRGKRCYLEFPPDLIQATKQFSQEYGVTPFMTLFTGVSALLHRYTGQEDVVIGVPVAGREYLQDVELIGLFLNTLPIRINLSGNPNFLELLNRVKAATIAAYSHQDIPFEKIIDIVQPNRDTNRSPLFQIMVQNTPEANLQLSNLTLKTIELDSDTSKLDLAFIFRENEKQSFGFIEYNSDLFMPETINNIATSFKTLLEFILSEPTSRLSDIEVLSNEQKEKLNYLWNKTDVSYPNNVGMHQLFEQQAKAYPQAIAIEYMDQRITYQALNENANHYASYLLEHGVKPKALVGVCLKRSIELIVALLGILKAGAAYIPLDPNFPKNRLDYMLKDAKTKFLVTEKPLDDNFTNNDFTIFTIDQIVKTTINGKPKQVNVNGDYLAYVIYTSGSTGAPKGVSIQHQALCNFLHSMQTAPGINNKDKLLSVTTYSFDISLLEFFLPLINGATVVLASYETTTDGHALAHLLKESRATIMQATPATWDLLLSTQWQGSKDLKILCGGEALTPQLAEALLKRGASLWNMYGPTETTIWSTCKKIEKAEDGSNIGRPITNTQIYILDKSMKLAPIGADGEIYIGGDGLSPGYLNRPELTQERFVANPHTSKKSKKLYKTGDIGRYLTSGDIICGGRCDNQVKLRGYRIELNEIESHLTSEASIQQALVVIREDSPGDKRLVAYLIANENENLSKQMIQNKLKEHLPAYMIPSQYVYLDAYPLTPNNKVDRKALPKPTASIEESDSYQEPTTEIEKKVAEIWSTVLNASKVGVDDDFFDLGGNSLNVMSIVATIRAQFTIELSVKLFYEKSTVKLLSSFIDEATPTQAVAIKKVDRNNSLELSYAQSRMWFLNEFIETPGVYNVHHGVDIVGHIDIDVLQKSLKKITKHHEILRTSFVNKVGHIYQQIHDSISLKVKKVNLTHLEGSKKTDALQSILNREITFPFDLNSCPLFRVNIIELEDSKSLLLFVAHHIIFDGQSMSIILNELAHCYEAYITNKNPDLVELPFQYIDYACWQKHRVEQTDILTEQIDYWKNNLSGELPVLSMPTDYPRPLVQSYKGERCYLEFPPDLIESIKQFSQKHGVTSFATLFSGVSALLHRYTGQKDIIIGVPVAGREYLQDAQLLGLFVNTMPMRIDLSGNPSFLELLNRVKATTTAAYSHQDIPFEKIIDIVQAKRDTSRSPLFQVMVQSTPKANLNLPELTLKTIELENHISKFDLAFIFRENEQQSFGFIEYSSDLFMPETIQNIAMSFQILLKFLVAEPTSRLSDIDLLSQDQKREIYNLWNHTDAKYSKNIGMHQLFEKQASSYPHAIAIEYKEQHITYHALNEKANHYATYLLEHGIKPKALVGVCLERTIELIAVLLGILKAGAAYIPLDPNFPKSRLDYMLKDAKTKFLVTEKPLDENFTNSDSTIFTIDQIADTTVSGKLKPIHVKGDDLAYVIYTSGSTGAPKGVPIHHRSLCNLLQSVQSKPGISSKDKFLSVTTYSFDISLSEFFLPLISGATVVLASYEATTDGHALAYLLRESRATIMQATPATWDLLLNVQWQGSDDLKIICTGEALMPQLAVELLKRGASLWNMYGPTETTIWSTCKKIAKAEDASNIGQPIANTQIYILDESMKLSPLGAEGEIYIGGDGLSPGYLNRPELTQERFVPNPHSSKKSKRLYRTGDVGRYLPSGDIICGGRCDNQVKLRGYRIELSEIEVLLTSEASIQQALVLIREDDPGDKKLIAYLIANKSKKLSKQIIQNRLKEHLPFYMLPSQYVYLDAFPLTPNNKVDRKALPKPSATIEESDLYQEPKTKIEIIMAEIWSKVLDVKKVGIDDNFFDLGGSSLQSSQVISEIEQQLSIKISPREFIFQTLRQLSKQLSNNQDNPETATQPNIQRNVLKPTFITTEKEQLFVCQHEAAGQFENAPSVILCYPIGQEYLSAHRNFKLLADKLSQLGFNVFRFDYAGCGDSSGEFHEVSINHWLKNINTLVTTIKSDNKNGKICMIGLRMGATLAMLYSDSFGPLDAAVLWEPIIDGKNYLSELKHDEIYRISNTPPRQSIKEIDLPHDFRCFQGFTFSHELQEHLQKLDLLEYNPIQTENLLLLESSEHQSQASVYQQFLNDHEISFSYEKTNCSPAWKNEMNTALVSTKSLSVIANYLKGVFE